MIEPMICRTSHQISERASGQLKSSPQIGTITFFTLVCGVLLCGVLPRPGMADDNVLPLLSRIPETANSLAIVRVQEILKSPRAIAEGWAGKQEEKLLFGAGVVPSWVDTLVLGSQVRLGSFSKDWSVAVLGVPPKFSLEGLAQREESRVEELGGLRAVRGRRDAYFVDLGERVLGVMSPAHRQDVARWARRAAAAKGGVSEYLTAASTTAAQILLALDVEDALDPISAREYLSTQAILDTAKVPLVDVLELLRQLRGVRILAIVKEQTEAKIVLDFSQPVDLPPEVLKALTINAINSQGLHLPELDAATTSVAGKTFVLSMDNMSDESLRAILSLIITAVPDRPAVATENGVADLATNPPGPKTPNVRVAAPASPDEIATKRYFDSVTRIVSDLERNLNRANDYVLTAMWHDNFASKIERLPISGVASEILDYGSRTSSRLRALAASLRGVAIKVNTQEGTIVYNTYVDPGYESFGLWGGYGYRPWNYNVTSNLATVRERQAAAIIDGAAQRGEIWQLIRDDRNSMIRKAPQIDVRPPK